MKKLIVLFLGFTLSTTVLFANNNEPTNVAKNELRSQIIKLLEKNKFQLSDSAFAKGEVSLLINNEGQIIILSVDSKNTLLESYVKRELNYKKIKTVALKKMKVYKMPLKIIKQ